MIYEVCLISAPAYGSPDECQGGIKTFLSDFYHVFNGGMEGTSAWEPRKSNFMVHIREEQRFKGIRSWDQSGKIKGGLKSHWVSNFSNPYGYLVVVPTLLMDSASWWLDSNRFQTVLRTLKFIVIDIWLTVSALGILFSLRGNISFYLWPVWFR